MESEGSEMRSLQVTTFHLPGCFTCMNEPCPQPWGAQATLLGLLMGLAVPQPPLLLQPHREQTSWALWEDFGSTWGTGAESKRDWVLLMFRFPAGKVQNRLLEQQGGSEVGGPGGRAGWSIGGERAAHTPTEPLPHLAAGLGGPGGLFPG